MKWTHSTLLCCKMMASCLPPQAVFNNLDPVTSLWRQPSYYRGWGIQAPSKSWAGLWSKVTFCDFPGTSCTEVLFTQSFSLQAWVKPRKKVAGTLALTVIKKQSRFGPFGFAKIWQSSAAMMDYQVLHLYKELLIIQYGMAQKRGVLV